MMQNLPHPDQVKSSSVPCWWSILSVLGFCNCYFARVSSLLSYSRNNQLWYIHRHNMQLHDQHRKVFIIVWIFFTYHLLRLCYSLNKVHYTMYCGKPKIIICGIWVRYRRTFFSSIYPVVTNLIQFYLLFFRQFAPYNNFWSYCCCPKMHGKWTWPFCSSEMTSKIQKSKCCSW